MKMMKSHLGNTKRLHYSKALKRKLETIPNGAESDAFKEGIAFMVEFLGMKKFDPDQLTALAEFFRGEPYGVSSFIDEDTIIAGYDGLAKFGFDFQHPLPAVVIKHIFKTNSWKQQHANSIGSAITTISHFLDHKEVEEIIKKLENTKKTYES